MSIGLNDVVLANHEYSCDFDFDKGDLAMSPGRQFSLLTCRDVHLDPAKYVDLTEGKYIHRQVMRIKPTALVSTDMPVYGYIYDVKTGCLIEVASATEAGRAGL